MWGLVLALLIAIIIATFASLNSVPVSVNLFFWKAPEISLALVVLFSVLLGVIMAALFGTPRYLKTIQKTRELERKIRELERQSAPKEPWGLKHEEEKKQTPPQD